ncbi:MAG: prolipoprotein diacylglyceryl transferase [Aureliella sp.]
MSVPVLYPIIMLTSLLVGGWLLRRSQQSLNLPQPHRVAIGLAAFCGAMIGAKAPFLLGDLAALQSGAAWFSNGKTIMCGMVGAYFAVELAKWLCGVKTKTGDSFVVPCAVAVGIGRWGCLVAGCCYGIPTTLPWGLQCAVTDDLVRHPTQIYESLFHLCMAGLMWHLLQRGIWRGQLAKFYILSYLGYRFATEFIRPEARITGGLTGYQLFAIALIPVFALLWWWDARQLRSQASSAAKQSLP